MARMIDADALLVLIPTIEDEYKYARKLIEQMPTIDLIHCKDCKHCQIDNVYHDYWCDGRKVWKDHYCGYAERKDAT